MADTKVVFSDVSKFSATATAYGDEAVEFTNSLGSGLTFTVLGDVKITFNTGGGRTIFKSNNTAVTSMGASAANTGSTPGIPIPSRWRWTIPSSVLGARYTT